MKEKDYRTVLDFLINKHIKPKEALGILERATTVNTDNQRSQWKMMRFTMYLWARIEEQKKGYLWKKIDTVKHVVKSKEYHNLYKTFNFGSFNEHKEVKNFNKLITDPRQFSFFKSMYFYYKGTKKNIPQETIDQIR